MQGSDPDDELGVRLVNPRFDGCPKFVDLKRSERVQPFSVDGGVGQNALWRSQCSGTGPAVFTDFTVDLATIEEPDRPLGDRCVGDGG